MADLIDRQAAAQCEMTLTLNSPITEEQWDAITDVDFEHTNEVVFHTKHGKEVKFVKASVQPIIRCKDCKYYDDRPCGIVDWYNIADDFCSYAERRTDNERFD